MQPHSRLPPDPIHSLLCLSHLSHVLFVALEFHCTPSLFTTAQPHHPQTISTLFILIPALDIEIISSVRARTTASHIALQFTIRSLSFPFRFAQVGTEYLDLVVVRVTVRCRLSLCRAARTLRFILCGA